jgi:uncharacterized membrane protein YoaK (UPF0700 family)
VMDTHDSSFRDIQGALLCFAMGLQNSLVTRLSGAVVRTTHLTGVVTDLGIEAARWVRAWRARFELVAGDAPRRGNMILLLTIFSAFAIGSVVGALVAVRWGQLAMLVPTLALFGGGLYAARSLAASRVAAG